MKRLLWGLTLLAIMVHPSYGFEIEKFNRRAVVHPMPPRNHTELAQEYSVILDQTNDFWTLEEAKESNPDVKIWMSYNPGIIWYNHNAHNSNPNVQGGFIPFSAEQKEMSIDAQMSVLIHENLKQGVDWFLRTPNGYPIDPYGAKNAAVLNVMQSCPKGVYGISRGLNVMETYAVLLKNVSENPKFKNTIDAIYFDMGGNLKSSLWAIGNNVPDSQWYHPTYGYKPAYLRWANYISRNVNMPLLVNDSGESYGWHGLDGSVRNQGWVDGYKMEHFLKQPGWKNNLQPHEKFLAYLGPYTREDARGNFNTGLRWIINTMIDNGENSVVQIQLMSTWSHQEQRRHLRLALGTYLLAANKDKGPYVSFYNYNDTWRPINQSVFSEFKTWTDFVPTGEMYSRAIDGKTLYMRKFTAADRWSVVLIVNPNETMVYGVPKQDSMVLIIDFLGFQNLMQWHKIL